MKIGKISKSVHHFSLLKGYSWIFSRTQNYTQMKKREKIKLQYILSYLKQKRNLLFEFFVSICMKLSIMLLFDSIINS